MYDLFKATISDVNLLKDSIATIAELIDEGIFRVTKEGMNFIAADRAMVAVVNWNLMASAFDKYEIDGEYDIGLNVIEFNSVLRRASKGDKITFDLEESKLEIVMEGTSKRKFVVPLLDLSKEEVPPIEQLAFTSKVELRPEILQSGIEDAEIIGDAVLIEISADKFEMKAEGDVRKTELKLEKGNEALIDIKSDSEVKSRYPLEYLKKMIKAAKIADSVQIETGKDYPMKMSFRSGDKCSLSFILAPRVTDDE